MSMQACRAAGCDKTFLVGGSEAAFVACTECRGIAKYCGEACRLEDRDRHFPTECASLTRRMAAGAMARCASCGAADKPLKKCGRCKQVYYCSAACQRRQWSVHKASCVKVKSLGKESKRLANAVAQGTYAGSPVPANVQNQLVPQGGCGSPYWRLRSLEDISKFVEQNKRMLATFHKPRIIAARYSAKRDTLERDPDDVVVEVRMVIHEAERFMEDSKMFDLFYTIGDVLRCADTCGARRAEARESAWAEAMGLVIEEELNLPITQPVLCHMIGNILPDERCACPKCHGERVFRAPMSRADHTHQQSMRKARRKKRGKRTKKTQ